MFYQKLKSSLVHSVEYEPNLRVLRVYLRRRGDRQFVDVPKDVFDKFCSASSPGRFYLLKVRSKFSRSAKDAG
jgi:hypothetical protein